MPRVEGAMPDQLATRVAVRAKRAGNLPSMEDVVRKWAAEVCEEILKAIPKRYKEDEGRTRHGIQSSYLEVQCKGTSVRDLETTLTVGFIADPFSGNLRGSIWWDEVGFGKQETDVNIRADQSGSELVDLVLKVIAQQERG
jgi:hypothetical protein